MMEDKQFGDIYFDEDSILCRHKISPMTEPEFQRIVEFMQRMYGIELKDKRTIVKGRLDNHVGKLGHKSYSEIMDVVERNPGGPEGNLLVDLLTTNYTYFLREFDHFEYWKNKVLPELEVRVGRSKDLRVWCGAASTGEEPYTIAMILSDYFGLDNIEWDTGILATDISVHALEIAVNGIYPKEKLTGLPYGWRDRYYRNVDAQNAQVIQPIRDKVTFSKLNLMEAFNFRKKMHTIFMRNVMIYFDSMTRMNLLDRLYEVMEPGGYLFIGMTENIDKKKTGFEYVRPAVYRKPL